jgi:hypothetical protein
MSCSSQGIRYESLGFEALAKGKKQKAGQLTSGRSSKDFLHQGKERRLPARFG